MAVGSFLLYVFFASILAFPLIPEVFKTHFSNSIFSNVSHVLGQVCVRYVITVIYSELFSPRSGLDKCFFLLLLVSNWSCYHCQSGVRQRLITYNSRNTTRQQTTGWFFFGLYYPVSGTTGKLKLENQCDQENI